MRFYLTFVAFGLLMFGLCVMLQPHALTQSGVAMSSLFGAHGDVLEQQSCAQHEALPA